MTQRGEKVEFDGWGGSRGDPWERLGCAALSGAWKNSAEILRGFCDALDGSGLLTVGVAGSCARMEACPASDLDLVVVGRADATEEEFQEADRRVRATAARVGFRMPQSHGIFAKGIREEELFAAPVGQIEESPRSFGVRIQWLLEMQPVFDAVEFGRIQRRILERYTDDFAMEGAGTEWNYLLNDLIRYFRALHVKYQWESRTNPARWELRNLKGAHSRAILYAGLMFLLGEPGVQKGETFEWVLESLRLTPLERIASVYRRYGDNNLTTVLRTYGDFVEWSGREESRRELGEGQGGTGRSAAYLRWKENGEELQRELMRFVLARREDWSPRFFQRLFF